MDTRNIASDLPCPILYPNESKARPRLFCFKGTQAESILDQDIRQATLVAYRRKYMGKWIRRNFYRRKIDLTPKTCAF